jgi:hypothetical protein
MTEDHHRETAVTPESGVMKSVVNFVAYLDERFPQVDTQPEILVEIEDGEITGFSPPSEAVALPKLNYYLVGSLATTLLAAADKVEVCAENSNSNIVVESTLEIPSGVKGLLTKFVRPVGDIDYIPSGYYNLQKKRVQDSFESVTPEQYRTSRSRFLWKGGGGLKYGDVLETARAAIKRPADREDNFGIMCDPFDSYGKLRYAKVSVDGHEFYIARPDTMVGYKMLHMLDQFDKKPEKFNKDFDVLYKAISQIYPESHLVQITHEILSAYDERIKKVLSTFDRPGVSKLRIMIRNLLDRDDLGVDARGFLEKVVSYDRGQTNILT